MQHSISSLRYFLSVALCVVGACTTDYPQLPPAYNYATKITDGFLQAVSPDGSMIAVTRQDTVTPHNIFVGTSTGENIRKVTVGEYPAFSPDGSKLVFARFSYSGSFWFCQLLSIDIATLQETRIVPDSFRSAIDNISWSPDGATISFRYDSSGFSITKIVASNGSGTIHNTLRAVYIYWSPDGNRFVGLKLWNYEMFIGSVGSDDTQPIGNGYGPDVPVWMPDGNTIAYIQSYSGILTYHFVSENSDSVQSSDLYCMTSSSQALQISRDGKKLVSLFHDYGNADVPSSSAIKYFSLPQKKITTVAFEYREMREPRWSPDATSLYFTRHNDRYEVYRYALND